MAKMLFKKASRYTLEAVCDDAKRFVESSKFGVDVLADASRPRNYKFHKKIFALVKFAYENTELPVVQHNGKDVTPSFDSFRHDLIVMSGFYEATVNIKTHTLKLVADSLEYRKCSEDKAEKIFSAMLDVISKSLFQGEYTHEELEDLSQKYLGFI